METLRRRLFGDRGAMGFLMALVMFFVCGMLTMTWNTYTLSREKMRVQDAVDAAALEHATWQARGMNCLQNLNEEGYDALATAISGYTISGVLVSIAQAVTAIPIIGPILNGALIGASVITCAASTWTCEVVLTFVKVAQKFYQYGTCVLGYLAAQEVASYNGATGLIGHFVKPGQKLVSLKMPGGTTLDLDIFAFGLSLAPKDTLILPVEEKQMTGQPPWDSGNSLGLNTIFNTIREIPIVGQVYWMPAQMPTFWPIVSKTATGKDGKFTPVLPSPTLWVALRDYPPHDVIRGFDAWFFEKGAQNLNALAQPKKSAFPVMAYAVGQCVTGDLTTNAPADHPTRPRGYGAGANAKLISLEEALSITNHATLQKAAGFLLYH